MEMSIKQVDNQVNILCLDLMRNYIGVTIKYHINPNKIEPEWIFVISYVGPNWWVRRPHNIIVDLLEKGEFLLWLDEQVQECIVRSRHHIPELKRDEDSKPKTLDLSREDLEKLTKEDLIEVIYHLQQSINTIGAGVHELTDIIKQREGGRG